MSHPEKLPKVDLFLGSYSVVIAENSSNMSKNNLLNLLRNKFCVQYSKVQIKNVASLARVTTESTCTTYQNLLSIDLQNRMNKQRNIGRNSGFLYEWFLHLVMLAVLSVCQSWPARLGSPQRNVSSLLNCFYQTYDFLV